MNLPAAIANSLWFASSIPEYRRFRRALNDPATTQFSLLKRLLGANASTVFGRVHDFASTSSYREFQARVPVTDYDGMLPFVDRIRDGEQAVLTTQSVTRLVPTSGTTSARKLIPFTAGLQAEFDRAIAPWIVDLALQRPGILFGPAYWSITPSFQSAEEESAVPIGFEHDASYLGGAKAWLVRKAIIRPNWQGNDLQDFQAETLRALIACRDLRLISVWHPSFLALLLERLPTDWREVWPRLQVISCWGDAAAEAGAAELAARFPGVLVQRKGLLATEAFVTIPFAGAYPLAIRSHFFEFIDEGGDVKLANQLRHGETYELVVTTGGGLWRYRLGDRVRVIGFVGNTPSLRFVGRAKTSDLRGEKLSEEFVGACIQRVLGQQHFAMLAPNPQATGYTLFVEAGNNDAFAEQLDDTLQENPHYALCREIGQLHAIRCFEIYDGAFETFARVQMANGARLGDVKPVFLSLRKDWDRLFKGAYRPSHTETTKPAETLVG